MVYKGRAWKFGANVDTDAIIPARYLNTTDPKEMASHLMEDVDPKFLDKIQPGDVLVAEDNFGCGSSREHAPLAIKHAGISCVVAKSFARIFYRNAFNMGLPILESVEAVAGIHQGDELDGRQPKGNDPKFNHRPDLSSPAHPSLHAAADRSGWVDELRETI